MWGAMIQKAFSLKQQRIAAAYFGGEVEAGSFHEATKTSFGSPHYIAYIRKRMVAFAEASANATIQ